MQEALGYEPDEFIGKPFGTVFALPDDPTGGTVLETARVDGSAVLAGWRVGRSGRRVLVSGHVSCLQGQDGEDLGFAVTMTPVLADDGRSTREEPVPEDISGLVAEAVWSLKEPFYVIDDDLRYLYANKHCETMWGVPVEEMVGRNMVDVFPELQDSLYLDRHIEALRERRYMHFEAYSPVRGRTVDVVIQPVTHGVAGVVRDPFDTSVGPEEHRQAVPASVPDVAVHRYDPSTGALSTVGGRHEAYGLEDGQQVRSLDEKLELMVPNDRIAYQRAVRPAVEAGDPWHVEYRIVRPRDGATSWLAEKGTPDDAEGDDTYVVMTWDITTMRRVEEQLRAGQRRLRRELMVNRQVYEVLTQAGAAEDARQGALMLIEACLELVGGERGGIWLLDRDDARLRVFAQSGFKGGYLSEFGEVNADVAGLDSLTLGSLVTHEVPEEQMEALAEDSVDGSQVRCLRVTLPGANGRVIGQLCLHVPADRLPQQRDLAAVRLMAMQAATLAERHAIEEHSDELLRRMEESARAAGDALLESEIRFRRAFELGPVAAVIATLDEDRFLEINEHYTKLTGYDRDEVVGRTAKELGMWSSTEDRQKLEAAFAVGGNFSELELRLRTKDGRIRDILLSGEEISYGGYRCMLKMFNDVTEHHRSQEELMTAIREVMADTEWFSQSVVQRLAEMRQGQLTPSEDTDLTPREREVLEYVAAGLTDDEVASQLGISQRTARNHLTNAYSKIGAHNRAEAIVWARERGLVARVGG